MTPPEIIPAEVAQADERPTPRSILRTIPARDFIGAGLIALAFYIIAAAVSAVLP